MGPSTQTQRAGNGNSASPDPEAAKQQAGDAAQALKDQAQQTAGTAVDQVKQSAFTQAGSQKDRISGSLNGLADTLHQAGRQLEDSDQSGFFAKYVHQAAGTVEGLADHLDNREINELVAEVETYAREQPAIFLGGAFVLGMLGARFLKSSGQRSNDSESASGYSSPTVGTNTYRAPVMRNTRDTATGVSGGSAPSAMPTAPHTTGINEMGATPTPSGVFAASPARPAVPGASPSSATGAVTPRVEDADRLDALRRGAVPHQASAHDAPTPNSLTGQSVRAGTGDNARNTETT